MSFDPTRIFQSRFGIIGNILEQYDGVAPFSNYLKDYFRKHKNFGAGDRRTYSAWSHVYFRLGNALGNEELKTRLSVAWYLVHGSSDDFFKFLNAGKIPYGENEDAASRVHTIKSVFPDFSLEHIFQFQTPLSGESPVTSYAESMLERPRVWIRINKRFEKVVEEELDLKQIIYQKDDQLPLTYSFDPGVKLDLLNAKLNKYFEIQDRTSQLAGSVIPAKQGEFWWDCCCGAGGKSLELFDHVPGIHITATDSRSTALKNFRERLRPEYKNVSTTVLDLEQPVNPNFFNKKFDGIIADAPCSGSGTWSRSPENLVYFKEAELQKYVSRQKTIVANAVQFLKPGGNLVYITCSVFKQENENVAEWISKLPEMKLESQLFLNGMHVYADSMFYAIFSKQ